MRNNKIRDKNEIRNTRFGDVCIVSTFFKYFRFVRLSRWPPYLIKKNVQFSFTPKCAFKSVLQTNHTVSNHLKLFCSEKVAADVRTVVVVTASNNEMVRNFFFNCLISFS